MSKGSWLEFEDPSLQRITPTRIDAQDKTDRQVRVKRIRAGKKGKTITVITGLELSDSEFKKLLKSLKAKCGTGGTFKENYLELQGDKVMIVLELLEKEGYHPKHSGG